MRSRGGEWRKGGYGVNMEDGGVLGAACCQRSGVLQGRGAHSASPPRTLLELCTQFYAHASLHAYLNCGMF